jgi:ABC-type multidrug transport system fused ATPase/permease subunit
MSKWDWIHAGLELATFTQAQKAQSELSQMRAGMEIETLRRALLEAMRGFVFDISRDIQLAEEQVHEYPQQVYIVSESLKWRLGSSGLSPEVFPDIQDKEYFFKTERKVNEVSGQAKNQLTAQQVQDSDLAVQYISELPTLQRAVTAKTAQESLQATEEKWGKLSSAKGRKNLLVGLGIAGLFLSACTGIMGIWGLAFISTGDLGQIIFGLALAAIGLGIPVGSIVMIVLGAKSDPEFAPLKANRENWRKQLMTYEDWQKVVSAFGELSSSQFQQLYDQRLAFLNPLLGGDFQKVLATGG